MKIDKILNLTRSKPENHGNPLKNQRKRIPSKEIKDSEGKGLDTLNLYDFFNSFLLSVALCFGEGNEFL